MNNIEIKYQRMNNIEIKYQRMKNIGSKYQRMNNILLIPEHRYGLLFKLAYYA